MKMIFLVRTKADAHIEPCDMRMTRSRENCACCECLLGCAIHTFDTSSSSLSIAVSAKNRFRRLVLFDSPVSCGLRPARVSPNPSHRSASSSPNSSHWFAWTFPILLHRLTRPSLGGPRLSAQISPNPSRCSAQILLNPSR